MKNVTKKLSGVTLGLMMAGGSIGLVQADVFNATATVSSTISLVETTALNLGTLYVTPDDADATGGGGTGSFGLTTAGVVSTSDGAVTTGTTSGVFVTGHVAKFVSLAAATVGVITVTGAAPFGTVTIAHGNLVDLAHSSANPSIPDIVFATMVTDPADAATLTLDASGDGDILVGGTFRTGTASAAYADGIYTGSYEINVAY